MITKPLMNLARTLMPDSIVGRAAMLILSIALLLSAVFAGAAAQLLQRNEAARLNTELQDLLSTVESTVSIACFVKDRQLAEEISRGLLRSSMVASVRIGAGDEVLYDAPMALAAGDVVVISRDVASPFKAEEKIGRITLLASQTEIQSKAWAYVRAMLIMLALQALLVATGVAWVVSNLITKPIKSISDDLHRLELRTGMQLRVPPINRQDEIGRLVSDVNSMIGKLTDLVDTERRLRLERERSERKLSLIFERADTGIFVADRQGNLLSWNPAFARMLPKVSDEKPRLQNLLAPDQSRAEALMERAANSPDGAADEFELQPGSGEPLWLQASIDLVDDDQFEGVINDISTHKRAEAAAQQLASHDPLTGLLNRRGLQAQLTARKIHPVGATTVTTALLMMDLDYFKKVNDNYGHAVGDQVLLHVSKLLQQTVRRTDLVARLGGDEFVIALVGIDSVATAESIAKDIIDAIRQPIPIAAEITASIGASIGLAIVSTGDSTLEAALERADQALYAVKQSGRGRVQLATPPGALSD
ncbi:MAG: diguanylate cyclase [Nevskiaceae bacterium]|nr:MAG: diguanylate cyclase [Nevskiaceae bacterium]TAM34015.1 MAG: diguanylate cyclase [Nevskiaceae bacterium]